MNSLILLLWDEFQGFIKSKIMIALWIGLPLITIIVHSLFSLGEEIPIPLLFFVSIFLSSISGVLATTMLSTSLVNELNANVYDLFLIRPVKRWQILMAKYIGVLVCLIIASLLSFAVGLVIDSIRIGLPQKVAILDALEALGIGVASMSISCAIGILIGIIVKSVAVAAILAIYISEQFSAVAVLPGFFGFFIGTIYPLLISLGIGVVLTVIIMGFSIFVFQRKQF